MGSGSIVPTPSDGYILSRNHMSSARSVKNHDLVLGAWYHFRVLEFANVFTDLQRNTLFSSSKMAFCFIPKLLDMSKSMGSH